MINHKTNTKVKLQDDYDTPKIAFEIIFKYIKIGDKDIVYAPFYNTGNLSHILTELKINHIHKDINFFTNKEQFDYIIDNPPYSIKHKILEHCLLLGKPFALLLRIDTLERQYFKRLFDGKDWTVIIPNKRIKFDNSINSPAISTAWFCFGFALDNQIIFD
jgi:hypothetical protein